MMKRSKTKHCDSERGVDSNTVMPMANSSNSCAYVSGSFESVLSTDVVDLTVFRSRLYELFGLIEKEFEALYAENIALRTKVAELSERCPGGADPDSLVSRATESLYGDGHSATDVKHFMGPIFGAGSGKKVSGSQVGQRLKTAFRVPQGKFVSSFKAGVGGSGDALRVRFIKGFAGHRDGVWDVSVSGNAARPVLGSASADQTARIWCPETGNCLVGYTGHTGSVNSIRFCPYNVGHQSSGEALVVTGGGDRVAHVWKVVIPNASKLPQSATDDEPDPGSEREEQTPANEENMLLVRTPKIQLIGHNGVIISADWLCDGCQIITASWDRTANIYDVETGEVINVLSGHDQELTHASAHSSQKLVVTCSKDSTFRLWDFRDPIHSVAVFQGHTEAVTSAVFASADNVVSGSDDRCVKVWDVKNMRSPVATIRLDSPINRLSVSGKYNIIGIPHDNRQIRLYDLSGARIARLPRSNRRGHRRMVCAVAWADHCTNGNFFTCGFDKMVLGWKYLPQFCKSSDG